MLIEIGNRSVLNIFSIPHGKAYFELLFNALNLRAFLKKDFSEKKAVRRLSGKLKKIVS